MVPGKKNYVVLKSKFDRYVTCDRYGIITAFATSAGYRQRWRIISIGKVKKSPLNAKIILMSYNG